MRSNDQTATDLVRPAGFEPATRCLEGTVELSRHVARHCSTSRLPAPIKAGCGLVPPGSCDRWLPIWLPESADSPGDRGPSQVLSAKAGGPDAGLAGVVDAVRV